MVLTLLRLHSALGWEMSAPNELGSRNANVMGESLSFEPLPLGWGLSLITTEMRPQALGLSGKSKSEKTASERCHASVISMEEPFFSFETIP